MTSSSRNRIEFELPTVTRRSTLSTTAERRGNNTLITQASSAEALHMTHGESFLLLQASSKQKKLHKLTDTYINVRPEGQACGTKQR